MTEQEQIEQMAKVIHDRLAEARCEFGSMNISESYLIAQKLVEHYQPKLPEDSVVLSRDNYNRLKRDSELYEARHEEKLKFFEKVYNQASKETAEKIFNDIIQALEERKDKVEAFYGVAESVGADIAIRTVKELAKQFGVEIKEYKNE